MSGLQRGARVVSMRSPMIEKSTQLRRRNVVRLGRAMLIIGDLECKPPSLQMAIFLYVLPLTACTRIECEV